MPRPKVKRSQPEDIARCFGLRIESDLLQLAIASPMLDGRYRLEIDHVECESPGGWFTDTGDEQLRQALETLRERHEIKQEQIAVSLDGDFCVTRVTMGTSDKVDEEQSQLAVRFPRYLQLGHGEKVIGAMRQSIDGGLEYSVTGVVNRSLIQSIYDALRSADLNATWVEPSLVGLARLIEQSQLAEGRPLMIADGTGTRWDVGIVYKGRLLLDYSPRSATTVEGFFEAMDGHIQRIKRFCRRHCANVTGEITQLMICGSGEKTKQTMEVFRELEGLQLQVMHVPNLSHVYEMNDTDRGSVNVPSVATVLPLLIGVTKSDVPDLFDQVRRARDLPLMTRILNTVWPIMAAVVVICVSYGMVTSQRLRHGQTAESSRELDARVQATQIRMQDINVRQELVGHLSRIRQQTCEPDWEVLFGRITQSLPESARLSSISVEDNGLVLLTGTVIDETVVFELVGQFRKLPEVTQVALQGTTPDVARGTQFSIRLMTSNPDLAPQTHDE